MTAEKLTTVLAVGETIAVDFKRCGNGASVDTCEMICQFLNRFGSDVVGCIRKCDFVYSKEFHQNNQQCGDNQPDGIPLRKEN